MSEPKASIERISVVGFGAMGSGIAQVCASAGFAVTAHDTEERFLERGLGLIASSLERVVRMGRLTTEEAIAVRGRIQTTTNLSRLESSDLVIEAVVEEIDVKKALFRSLDAICPPKTIFVSNTSSLTIVEMAGATTRADRFAGLHFFNPPVMMPLVEIVRAITTSDETIEALRGLVRRLDHVGVVCSDTTGFIVNRLLVPYLNAAVRMLEEGVATADEIDQAVRLGLRHPMGPFELIDYTGVDINVHVGEAFFNEFRQPHMAPPSLLRRMFLAGRLGLKTRHGFYRYDEKGKRIT